MPTKAAAAAHVEEMREIRRRNAHAQAYIARVRSRRAHMVAVVAALILFVVLNLVWQALGLDPIVCDY